MHRASEVLCINEMTARLFQPGPVTEEPIACRHNIPLH